MKMIAIQPDNYGKHDTSSELWIPLLERAGFDVQIVDVNRSDIIRQLDGCVALMWRHAHVPSMRQIARRLLPVVENELGLLVYPDQKTCWHYDDKIAQKLLFDVHGIPTPNTWVFFSEDEAHAWSRETAYPFVIKLWAGAGSTNVMLVNSVEEAERWIVRLFQFGVTGLAEVHRSTKDRMHGAWNDFRGIPEALPWEVHRGYLYAQEFLPGNAFDTRVTVIGERAFVYRRFNRQGDFRASGSGNFDVDPQQVDKAFIRLAFDTARKLQCKSMAIDGLYDGERPVIGEISYTYVSWMVHACPGYWDTELDWHAGQMWPEEAQVEDFVARLRSRF